MIRAFIAVSIPPEIVGELALLIRQIDRLGLQARLSRPESIHLTLKFLGNIEESRVPSIAEQLERVARKCAPFQLRLRNLGAFPRPSQPRVVWLGIDSSEGLLRLQKGVEASMGSLDFESEDRPFRPHLTLARIKSRRRIAHLLDFLGQQDRVDLGTFSVSEFHLFQSRLQPEGAVYRRLHTFALENS